MGGKSRKCVICGVMERHRPGFFSNFPLDETRCKTWIRLVGNEDLVHLPIELLHELRHVCADHFTEKDFNKKGNRLKKTAIPKLKLTAPPLTEEQMLDFPQHLPRDPTSRSHAASTSSTNNVSEESSKTQPSSQHTQDVNTQQNVSKSSSFDHRNNTDPQSEKQDIPSRIIKPIVEPEPIVEPDPEPEYLDIPVGDPTAETRLLIVADDTSADAVRVAERTLRDSDEATDAESHDDDDHGNDVDMDTSDDEFYDVEYLSMFDDDGGATEPGDGDIIISDPKYRNVPSCEVEAGELAGQEGEVHEGTACSVCKGAVRGFRYTCIECVYELCRVCEALGAHAHHHVLRVPCPRPYGEVESVVELVRQALRCREHSQVDFEEVRCDVTDTMSVKSMRTECDPFSDVRSERSAGAFPDSDTDSQVDVRESFRRPPAPPPPRPVPAAVAPRRVCAGADPATPDSHVARTRSAQDYNMKGKPAILKRTATKPTDSLTHGSSQTGQHNTKIILKSKTDQPSSSKVNIRVKKSLDEQGRASKTLVVVLPPKIAKNTARRQKLLEMIKAGLRNQDVLNRIHKLNEKQLSNAESGESKGLSSK